MSQGRSGCGCFGVVVGVLFTLWLASQIFGIGKGPCDEARDAAAIARGSTGHDRLVASMQAEVKQAECDAQK
ncbi:hypothetical protein [Cellulomonas sp.]|uniref:hypothetical protein n=1 Tax=Cellulomonas sp. TaxID=40001 RepID=UPI001B166A5C|nr:hypothetical protein [Cellulomonas sp.]MBO9555591.1 hypothetical protein [Cellulomonas sp.]